MSQDEEQLRLLSIFHYIWGGLTALFTLFPLFYLGFGLMIINSPQIFAGSKGAPPAAFGMVMVIIGAVGTIIALILAGCIIATGRFLADRRNYTFCFVIACIECLSVPLGTALGVFTIITLTRDSVKMLFMS